MKYAILVSLIFCLSGCAKKGDSPATAAVAIVGTDMSGTYSIVLVNCYNAAGTAISNHTSYSGSFADHIAVTGNSFIETSTSSSGACVISLSGTMTATTSSSLNMTATVTSATNGSCSFDQTLSGVVITPTTLTRTFTTGQTISASGITYISGLAFLGLLTVYTDGGGGQCYSIYSKQ